jgi:hypothetical protein
MIIPAIAVLIAAAAPAFGMVATNRRAPQVQRLGPVANEHIDMETGLIKSWKAADELDSSILRQAIESGQLVGYKTVQVKEEYPRYRRFTNKCLSDKISNLRRAYRELFERRADSEFFSFSSGVSFFLCLCSPSLAIVQWMFMVGPASNSQLSNRPAT